MVDVEAMNAVRIRSPTRDTRYARAPPGLIWATRRSKWGLRVGAGGDDEDEAEVAVVDDVDEALVKRVLQMSTS